VDNGSCESGCQAASGELEKGCDSVSGVVCRVVVIRARSREQTLPNVCGVVGVQVTVSHHWLTAGQVEQ